MKSGKSRVRLGRGASPTIPALLLLSAGCVNRDFQEVQTARSAYEACVAEHSESDPECESLERIHVDAQERYEERARRAWSCDPAQEECPTPR